VNFDPPNVITQTATAATATQLTVQIPAAIPGVTSAGRNVSVTVTVGGQTSPAKNYFIVAP
jgi:hypothetical protein